MVQNIIEIKNVSIKYKDVNIIENISLNIRKGEFLSFIGPNGAGKSTLLKGILKNLELNSGEIFICEKNLKNISYKDKAKIIGFVPQEFSISFDFTVEDIVAMGRNPYIKRFGGMNTADFSIIEDAMKKTNIYKFKDESFNNLSGGEKQRVIIARTLAQEPEILILDEATSNLDIHHQLDVLELVKRLNKEEKLTVITVMHDLNMASRFSDTLVLIDKGKIVKEGTPEMVMCIDVLSGVYNMDIEIRDNEILHCKEIIPIRTRHE